MPMKINKSNIIMYATPIPPLCYVGFVYLLALTGVRWYQTMTAPYNFLNYNAPTGWFGWDLKQGGIRIRHSKEVE